MKSIGRGHGGTAIHQLQAFQHKVHAQVAKSDPALAEAFTQGAQDIINVLSRDCTSSKPHGHIGKVSHHPHGKAQVQFTAPEGLIYIIEASTNLVDWEKIGVATNAGSGEFHFEDPNTAQTPVRFYRVVVP